MITDIDKSNHDRNAPRPNTHDNLALDSIMAKGTNSTNYITPATNQATQDAGKNGQFTIVQVGSYTTTSTITLNNPGAGNFGNSLQTFYQQPHNLGFLPGFLAYEQSSSGLYTPMPFTNFLIGTSSQAIWYTFEIFVDPTNVYLDINATGYGVGATFLPGFIFKWFLLLQTSN